MGDVSCRSLGGGTPSHNSGCSIESKICNRRFRQEESACRAELGADHQGIARSPGRRYAQRLRSKANKLRNPAKNRGTGASFRPLLRR
jgi:hypothetical protein